MYILQTVTIATYQRGLKTKRGPWIEACEILDNAGGRGGQLLQETVLLPTEGGPIKTIAVRWTGRGISVYKVLATTDGHFGPRYECVSLHEGL